MNAAASENQELLGSAPAQPPGEALAPVQLNAALREVLRELLNPAVRLEELRRKELLSSTEVEELYGLNSGTLRNWRAKSLGPKFSRFGQLVFYKHQDLQNFIAAHQVRTYEQQ